MNLKHAAGFIIMDARGWMRLEMLKNMLKMKMKMKKQKQGQEQHFNAS